MDYDFIVMGLYVLSMDKWATCGHFYLYVDSVWSLYNIGPCLHVIVHGVFWVELPVQRKLCSIFGKSWSRKRGHDVVVSGYSTSTSIPRIDGLSTGPPG